MRWFGLLTVLIVIFSCHVRALEDDISRAFFSRCGIIRPVSEIVTLARQCYGENTSHLQLTVAYDDIFHYRDGNGRQASLLGATGSGQFIYPIVSKQSALFYQGDILFNSYGLDNFNEYISTAPGLLDGGVRFGTYLAEFPFNSELVAWGGYGLSGADNILNIIKFPHDDKWTELNTYLLDLLEPTFGDRITYNLDLGTTQAGVRLRKSPFFLDSDISVSSGQIDLGYENTSTTRLKGEKQAEFGLRSTRVSLVTGVEIPVKERYTVVTSIQGIILRDSLNMLHNNPAVNDSGLRLDKPDWGGGKIRQQGGGGTLGLDLGISPVSKLQVRAQVGYSVFSGSGRIATPVLGYDTVVVPIPEMADISHSFTGDLTGTIFSHYYRVTYQHQFNKDWRWAAALGYMHTGIDLFIDGDALSAWGFLVTPVDADYRLAGNVFELKTEVNKYLTDRLAMGLTLYQLVPLFEKVKEVQHTGPKPKPKEPVEKNVRGGTELRLTTNYSF